ncbi:MAG: SagB/ThcOx family dehydrogenase [Dehalococcoidales bacterium]|nr:SagB/ThcOx family dehydrogenase [Dehalococcoidales bacterium]
MVDNQKVKIQLPSPFLTGGLSLTEAISQRRSIRSFSASPIQLFQLSQILWAAQGTTRSSGRLRAIPSAGAAFPLEIYAVIGETGVEDMERGVYHYEMEDHASIPHIQEDIRSELAGAAMGQDYIAVAPVSLVICALYDKTFIKYNVRGERYVFMEVGHAGQNIYLQATAFGLGTVAVGAFRDDSVRALLQLRPNIKPLYIMPVGKPAQVVV